LAERTSAERASAGGGRIAAARDFLVATRIEMRKVTWPTRPELVKATRMIIILSVVLGVTIGLLDFGLQKILVDGVARIARYGHGLSLVRHTDDDRAREEGPEPAAAADPG